MNFNEVFSFENLYKSALKSCKGVRWKTSTQLFEQNILKNVMLLYEQLNSGKYKSKGFYEFDIKERGKQRHIKSVHITERVVQKCLCDYCLTPLFKKSLIYDSGATMKGKGLAFAVKRLKVHLRKHYQRNGINGYILLFDIKHFFDTVNHDILVKEVFKKLIDEKLRKLYKHFVDCFGGEFGIGLGSQISQLSALIYLSPLDHEIKDKYRVKYYGRYMDDGYLICKTKEQAYFYLQIIRQKLKELKLELSEHKTQIIKLSSGFRILKRGFYFTKSGALKIKPYKKNITRYRRKCKKLYLKGKQNALEVLRTNFLGYLREFKYRDYYTRRALCIN